MLQQLDDPQVLVNLEETGLSISNRVEKKINKVMGWKQKKKINGVNANEIETVVM